MIVGRHVDYQLITIPELYQTFGTFTLIPLHGLALSVYDHQWTQQAFRRFCLQVYLVYITVTTRIKIYNSTIKRVRIDRQTTSCVPISVLNRDK